VGVAVGVVVAVAVAGSVGTRLEVLVHVGVAVTVPVAVAPPPPTLSPFAFTIMYAAHARSSGPSGQNFSGLAEHSGSSPSRYAASTHPAYHAVRATSANSPVAGGGVYALPFFTLRKKTLPSARLCCCPGQKIRGDVPHPAVYPSFHRLSIHPYPQNDEATSANVAVAGFGYGGLAIAPYAPRITNTALSARFNTWSGQNIGGFVLHPATYPARYRASM